MSQVPVTPEVGMGATLNVGSDSYPYTIVRVITPRKIEVQQDKATRVDKNGMSESQEYTFTPNPNAAIHTYSLRKDGYWKEVGKDYSGWMRIGTRDSYYDFSH